MQRILIGLAMALLVAQSSSAQTLTVKIDNLTGGLYFTPALVAAHPAATHLFQPGVAASANLRALAEGGSLTGLTNDMTAVAGNVVAANVAPLAPGATVTTTVLTTTAANTHLSLVAMLLPTNDGFVGMDGLQIPTTPGSYTYYLNAWDAGTEANDELITGGGAPGVPGIPVCPAANCGTGGTGAAVADSNSVVHIHRGTLGDNVSPGGVSDLYSTVHRWLNPVARLTITVN